MLTRSMLHTGMPKEEVLCCLSDESFCPSNTNIGHWHVVQPKHLRHMKVLGWISLSNLPTLRTDSPPEVFLPSGHINCVLTKYSDNFRQVEFRGKWGVSNTAYYNLHRDEFVGWLGLELIEYPTFTILDEIAAYQHESSHVVLLSPEHVSAIRSLRGSDLSKVSEKALDLRVFITIGDHFKFLDSMDQLNWTGHDKVTQAPSGNLPTIRDLLK